ncbi:hypothetical protein RHSIM_Rhsim06G0198000 [Rhododendron simsii]|uniref:RING-type domain-containing protein n=1 Tax=Rhododendron simsii TaxID=118357 RepID=A0A834GV37_RHOSS|nr:hypothetical protein RHSIM_Rhsim06G0198000 [Rhododendron simsii]
MVSLWSDNIAVAWIVMMIVLYFIGFCTKVPLDEAHQDSLGGITLSTPDLEAGQGGSGGNDHQKREYKYDGNCAVCLEELREGETSRVLVTCGHSFHPKCIRLWLGNLSCLIIAAKNSGPLAPLYRQAAAHFLLHPSPSPPLVPPISTHYLSPLPPSSKPTTTYNTTSSFPPPLQN